MTNRVSDVMTDEVVYLLPHESAGQAAREMKKLNVGIIPICDEQQRLLGVVTDRDIVLRVVAEGRDADATLLGDIATMDPIAGQRDWDVSAAVELMRQYQIRRLPVVEGGRLVGILSIGDIAVHVSPAEASEALEEISQPAMPRKSAVTEAEHTAGTG